MIRMQTNPSGGKMDKWDATLLVPVLAPLVMLAILVVINFRALSDLADEVGETRREVHALVEKSRLDNTNLMRQTWREAQAVLLAEMAGNVRDIREYINQSDKDYKEWEVSYLDAYRMAQHRRGRGDAPRQPENGAKLDYLRGPKGHTIRETVESDDGGPRGV